MVWIKLFNVQWKWILSPILPQEYDWFRHLIFQNSCIPVKLNSILSILKQATENITIFQFYNILKILDCQSDILLKDYKERWLSLGRKKESFTCLKF